MKQNYFKEFYFNMDPRLYTGYTPDLCKSGKNVVRDICYAFIYRDIYYAYNTHNTLETFTGMSVTEITRTHQQMR